jgi:hypothetical protein
MGLSAPPGSWSRVASGLSCAVVLALGGCSDSEGTKQLDQASIQTALEEYSPRLADAYGVGDLEGLLTYEGEHGLQDARVIELLGRHRDLATLPLRERLDALLTGVAVEKEIAGLEKRVGDLLAEGRVIRPVPKSIQVESIETWRYVNAFATTVEVWDLRIYAAGTDVLLSETLDQRNRVKYQLQREGDRWLVLFRELDATFE